ncbi:hypothetical protein LCGC14_2815710, partial [marine sediment metagenome]
IDWALDNKKCDCGFTQALKGGGSGDEN